MIELAPAILLASATFPLLWALRANWQTCLRFTILWALAAWCSWTAVAFVHQPGVLLYVALCLTGCAAVALLGARRPQAGAWNFVVLSLLAVMLLPIVEGAVFGNESFGFLRLALVGGTIALGVMSYLPTRLGLGAVALAAGVAAGLVAFHASQLSDQQRLMALKIAVPASGLAPWIAFATLKLARQPASEVDRLWLGFRDRFGLFWSLRVREQFNRAAANAGCPFRLGWRGLSPVGDAQGAAVLLQDLQQRFVKIRD